MQVAGDVGGNDNLLMGFSGHQYIMPVYLYDEEKDARGKKMAFFGIPSWIVKKVRIRLCKLLLCH